jgi:hypothetical protein
MGMEKKIKKGGSHVWRGEWRAYINGGREWEFGGVWKMKAHIEVPLELVFCPKPPNFGVETHIEAPTGVAIRVTTIIDFSLRNLPHSSTEKSSCQKKVLRNPT